MNLSNRISKVERAIKPAQIADGIIIAHTQEVADKKICKFREENPLAATPCILIVPDIKKPVNSGIAEN